jgi:tetratricopeptide (TPR) repeat protein
MLLFLFMWSADPVFAISPAVSDVSSPEQHLVQGWRWFQQGAFDQAITSWMEAARLYGRAGNPNKQSETLTYLSRAYRSIGQHRQALQNLESTPALVKSLYRWQWQTGRLLKALGKIDDAISAYGRAVATF